VALFGWTYVRCHVCHGRGIIATPDGKEWQLCPRCKGEGYVKVPSDKWTWTTHKTM